jgi:hypothetical protein
MNLRQMVVVLIDGVFITVMAIFCRKMYVYLSSPITKERIEMMSEGEKRYRPNKVTLFLFGTQKRFCVTLFCWTVVLVVTSNLRDPLWIRFLVPIVVFFGAVWVSLMVNTNSGLFQMWKKRIW